MLWDRPFIVTDLCLGSTLYMSAPTDEFSDNIHRDETPGMDSPLGASGRGSRSGHRLSPHAGHGPGRGAAALADQETIDRAKFEAGSKSNGRSNFQRSSSATPFRAVSSFAGQVPKKSSADISDEDLFCRYQQGDHRAFVTLYEKFKAGIYAYCARTLLSAGLGEELVEDAFQEVFLRIAQYQHTFTGGEFKAWLFTVTRHTCLSIKKKGVKHRVTTEHVGDAENLEEGTGSNIRAALTLQADSPLDALSKREQTDLLLKAIAELPETYREALLLSEFEGMTYDEIGKLTGTSLSTIRIRIFRAKARLRKVLLPIIGDEADRLIGFDPNEEA